jgi:hypothetical protein
MKYQEFLKTMPEIIVPALPESLHGIKVRQPYRWLIQFHYGEPRLHYEVSRSQGQKGLELGFHCESRDKALNRLLLFGFRQHLFEIKDVLGESMEAEMWDRGWTKIYDVYPLADFTAEHQQEVGQRMVKIIACIHPIYVELRSQAQRVYR